MKKPPPSSAGASATIMSTMILPCGVSRAANDARCGLTLSMSAVSSPLRNLRASSPATFTTPRSPNSAAFIAWIPEIVCRNLRARGPTLKAITLEVPQNARGAGGNTRASLWHG
jgi:hypothetical protein